MSKRKSPDRIVGLERLVTERVIQARQDAGLNKRELGERLGLADSSYSPYENFRISFTINMLERLARIVDMPVEWFLGVESELTDDEQSLLSIYRRAVSAGRGDMVLSVLKTLAKSMEE